MTERWRCFVAVPLPNRVRSALSDVVGAWRRDPFGPDLRWTDAAGWHLTLAFLGWIDAGLSDDILRRLVAPAREMRPIELAGGGLGAFPSPRRARVLWYGMSDAAGAARSLAEGITKALAPIVPRVEEGTPFRPHVTLARVRAARGIDLSAWVA